MSLVTPKCYADMLRTQLPLFELEIIRFQFFQTFSKVSLVTQKCYAGMLRTQLPCSEVEIIKIQLFQTFSKASLVTPKCYAPVTLLWSSNYKNPTFSNIFQSVIGYAKMLCWYVTHPVTVLQSWNYKNPTFWFFSNIFQVFLGCIKCYADMLRTSYPALKLKW